MSMTAIAAIIAAAISIAAPVLGEDAAPKQERAEIAAPQPSVFEIRQAFRMLPDRKPEG